VLKFGGEKALTKHTTIDDGFPKYHMPLDEANKLIESNVKILDSRSALGMGSIGVKPMRGIVPKPSAVKPRETRAKANSFKCRLGKIMHKLYDLEPEGICVPEKPLNVDLGVNLYQMEDF
jgi:hypothetical protein